MRRRPRRSRRRRWRGSAALRSRSRGARSPVSLRPDPLQPRGAVGAAAALELVEPGQLLGASGDDHLPVAPGLDPALGAVDVEGGGALDAEARLQRARPVVDAGVDDPARVAALVAGRPRLPLQHRDPRPGVPAQSARAVARPTIPAPTTAKSQLAGGRTAFIGLTVLRTRERLIEWAHGGRAPIETTDQAAAGAVAEDDAGGGGARLRAEVRRLPGHRLRRRRRGLRAVARGQAAPQVLPRARIPARAATCSTASS